MYGPSTQQSLLGELDVRSSESCWWPSRMPSWDPRSSGWFCWIRKSPVVLLNCSILYGSLIRKVVLPQNMGVVGIKGWAYTGTTLLIYSHHTDPLVVCLIHDFFVQSPYRRKTNLKTLSSASGNIGLQVVGEVRVDPLVLFILITGGLGGCEPIFQQEALYGPQNWRVRERLKAYRSIVLSKVHCFWSSLLARDQPPFLFTSNYKEPFNP